MGGETNEEEFAKTISEIKETTKWILTAVAGVLGLALGGIQLGGLKFTGLNFDSAPVVVSTAVLVGTVVVALYFAIDVLVGEGGSFATLLSEKRFKGARDYINAEGAPYKSADYVTYLDQLKAIDLYTQPQGGAKRAKADDDAIRAMRRPISLAVQVANWRSCLERFSRLKITLFLLVPIAMASALTLGARENQDNTNAADAPAKTEVLPPSDADLALLSQAGWSDECLHAVISDISYARFAPDLTESIIYSAAGCPALRAFVQDRHLVEIVPK